MKAELFKRTYETVTDGRAEGDALIPIEQEEKVLELKGLDEIRIGLQKIVFIEGEESIAVDKMYNRHTGRTYRLVIDGEEVATFGEGRHRFYYSHTGEVIRGSL